MNTIFQSVIPITFVLSGFIKWKKLPGLLFSPEKIMVTVSSIEPSKARLIQDASRFFAKIIKGCDNIVNKIIFQYNRGEQDVRLYHKEIGSV